MEHPSYNNGIRSFQAIVCLPSTQVRWHNILWCVADVFCSCPFSSGVLLPCVASDPPPFFIRHSPARSQFTELWESRASVNTPQESFTLAYITRRHFPCLDAQGNQPEDQSSYGPSLFVTQRRERGSLSPGVAWQRERGQNWTTRRQEMCFKTFLKI